MFRDTLLLTLLTLSVATSLYGQDKRATPAKTTTVTRTGPSKAPQLPVLPSALAQPSPDQSKASTTSSLIAQLSALKKIELNQVSKAAKPTWAEASAGAEVDAASINLVATQASPQLLSMSPEASAREQLASLSLPLRSANEELRFLTSSLDEAGTRHLRLGQHFQGVPVLGGEIILHQPVRAPATVTGRLQPSLKQLELSPTLSSEDATEAAYVNAGPRAAYSPEQEIAHNLRARDEGPELVIFFDREQHAHLAYLTTIHPSLGKRFEMIIDAQSGEVLRKLDEICHAFDEARFRKTEPSASEANTHELSSTPPQLIGLPLSIEEEKDKSVCQVDLDFGLKSMFMPGPRTAQAVDLNGVMRTVNTYEGTTFFMCDVTRPMFQQSSQIPNRTVGALMTNDAQNSYPGRAFKAVYGNSPNNTWSDAGMVSAHYNTEQSYDYFRRTFSRNSIDGNGGTIVSFVNVSDEDGSNLDNAFWDGSAMYYGSGKDYFSHFAGSLDLGGHEMSHGVVQESAGLEYQDESGALNESFADVFGVMIDRDDWTIGETVVKRAFFPNGALRDFADPHNGGTSADYYWQPSHYSERYLGSEDNGGVHINSGIPNHTAYLIAQAIGRDKTERLFYQVLTNYLTRSSRFVDLRAGVEQAARTTYGANSPEFQAVTSAFNTVGIPGSGSGGGGGGTTTQPVNPGDELVVHENGAGTVLRLATQTGQTVFEDITPSAIPLSRPSVSDDGSQILIATNLGQINQIRIDYRTQQITENLVDFDFDRDGDSDVRNVALSRDGKRIALLTNELDPFVYVFDLPSGASKAFELYSPGSNGEKLYTVDYADALEFDYSGRSVIFDALNTITGQSGLLYSNWNIGVLEVFSAATGGTFSDGRILDVFGALEAGTSVGNPTLAKNSENIMAIDFYDTDDTWSTLAVNLETGDVNRLWTGDDVSWPSYSASDTKLYFATKNNNEPVLGVINLQPDKISNSDPQGGASIFSPDADRGTAFANGSRVINTLLEGIAAGRDWTAAPNPSTGELRIFRRSQAVPSQAPFELYDVMGRRVLTAPGSASELDLQVLPKGSYVLRQGETSQLLVKE